MTVSRARRVLLASGAVLLVMGVAQASHASACLFSNVASAYANGVVARHVTALPGSAKGEALWAPFVFRADFSTRHPIHLREDMREVAKSLGRGALHWRVRWLFGDGTRAVGVDVTHVYHRNGLYKIEVQSYYSGGRTVKGWYNFDLIDAVVGPLPKDATWVSATPAPSATAAAIPGPAPSATPPGG